MHSYRVSGLAVQSEIDLPGLIPSASVGAATDIVIRMGAVPTTLEGATEVRPTYQIASDLFLFRIPGIARFLLRAGREMTIQTESDTPIGDVAIFIIGTVFGILLHQREQTVLHASAVNVGGKAVLFCGPSGAGKSTIAAALDRRGYAMITDDVCAIGFGEDRSPMVQPDGRLLKLWAQAIDKLELAQRRGAAVRGQLEKFYVEPQQSESRALPLGAVYILRETRPPLRDGIEQPNFVDAAILIRRHAYRPRLVVAMQQSAKYLQSAAAIVVQSGVYYFSRPLEFAAMPTAVGQLEQHWRELGLLKAAP